MPNPGPMYYAVFLIWQVLESLRAQGDAAAALMLELLPAMVAEARCEIATSQAAAASLAALEPSADEADEFEDGLEAQVAAAEQMVRCCRLWLCRDSGHTPLPDATAQPPNTPMTPLFRLLVTPSKPSFAPSDPSPTYF